MSIKQALSQAKKTLLTRRGVHGVSRRGGRIVVYASKGVPVPSSILGVGVEVVRSRRFRKFEGCC